MRFRKITFHNYRCFVSGSVTFEEDLPNGKNINLILGSNGSGKTEILFSFIWTLYGYDFGNLKGKEDTPYALNSDRYRRLGYSASGTKDSCWVEIVLENNNKKYFIKRTAVYEKQGSRITSTEEREFSYQLASSERSLPIRDDGEIDNALHRIIPKSTLTGLVFDGERMQKLSRVDTSSKQTVKGVIRDITNIELLNIAKNAFTSSRDAVQRGFRGKGLSKQAIERELIELADIQEQATSTINELTPALEQFRESLEEHQLELESIKEELERNAQSRELAIEQKGYIEQKKMAKDELDSAYEDLEAALADGYLLGAEPLFSDVVETIETCDVPEGLLAPTVASILERPSCICERPIDAETRDVLVRLMESLPPNNINSTLGEWVRSLRISADDVKESARRCYDRIVRQEETIAKADEHIRRISSELESSPVEEISKLESQRKAEESEVAKLELLIQEAETQIEQAKNQQENAVERQKELAEKHDQLKETQVQIDFYEKALKAIDKIRDYQEREALARINDYLKAAYSLISEDAKLGRRLYLVQFHKNKKYQMVVYNQKAFDDRYEYMAARGDIARLAESKSNDEIAEDIILQCAESNSTGQNKINTLAFVKAILDFSNEEKGDESLEVSKDYPLLIDAPFGDIFDDNLVLSSRELHTFAGQIILMLAEESFESVKGQLGRYVSTTVRFGKVDNESRSIIGGN